MFRSTRPSRFAVAIIFVIALAITAISDAKAKLNAKADFQVVLLGVGTPVPFMHRFGPATLVVAGGKYLLFDAGRGVTQRLWQDKIPFGRIDHLFLTHLHSDHVVGIPDLLLTGWLTSPFARRKGNFVVSGPAGTADMMKYLTMAYAWDIETRIKDQGLKRAGVTSKATDIGPGVVYDQDGVKVTAIAVNHGEKIQPALGYRIDYDGRSVVISGDTKYHEPLAAFAKGADLFVHAVAAAKPELIASAKFWQVILDHHTSPEDVGRIFDAAKPKMAAFYHLVTLTNGKIKPPSVADLVKRTRTTYKGPLTPGADRLRFEIGKDGVKVMKPGK
ncbi:MAG: MBL fold metallo-hydrolase [Rhodospirillaceae bacterium]|jgi:ribonuclease Z|nr:MBL fold metallo-hydrolase [Rhodospirillaceae bacterium]